MTIKRVAIVGVLNEEKHIQNVIRQIDNAQIEFLVVVCNGCTDETLARTLEMSKQVHCQMQILWVPRKLGHDVSRAMGTLCAMRKFPEGSQFIYVDGDWGGAFGPNLSDMSKRAEDLDIDVLCISQDALRATGVFDEAIQPWLASAKLQNRIPSNALPFVLPMIIHKRTFTRVSALLLADPGRFYAHGVRACVNWGVYSDWQLEWVGHQTRSKRHHEDIAKRIEHDGLDAYCILSGRPFRDHTPIRHLPTRDVHTLANYAASAHLNPTV